MCCLNLQIYIHSFSNVEETNDCTRKRCWNVICTLMELTYLLSYSYFIMRMSIFTFISVLRLVAWLVNLQVATAYELP